MHINTTPTGAISSSLSIKPHCCIALSAACSSVALSLSLSLSLSMAPKRSSALDDPPSASSSSSTSSSRAESEEINDHEEQEQNKGVAESEEEEESGDEEEEEEEVKNKTPPPVQTPTPTATPQPQSSSASEGSDSEEDSGGTQNSPTASDFAVKPIISKPMDDSSTKHKKPTMKTPKSGVKRPAESEEKRKESQQKKKRKVAANGDEKKSAINRWSEDDEIVVLKGMVDFQKKKGPISNADMGAFLEFIKKSLHVGVSKNQLVEKVRRLKRKYWSAAVKGEEPVFSKPHDIKCLELAKKIWGGGGSSNNAFVEGVKSNSRKARKSVKVSNSPKEEEQRLALQQGLNGEVKEGLNGEAKDIKVGQEDFCSMYPCLQESVERYANLSAAGRSFIKGSMSLIGSVKAKELEDKWKKFLDDEIALYLQEIEFIQEQTKLIFEAMKSLNS